MMLSIIEQALMAFPLVFGAYLTLSLLKLPDFSIESAYLFGAVTAFLAKDLDAPFMLISAMVGGCFVGGIVSILNQFLRIPFLLAAIITNGFFHGFTQYLLGTSVVSFQVGFSFPPFGFIFVVGVITTLFMALMARSQLGFSLAIFGNNPQFFESHRISTSYVVILGVMIGHGLAGIGGFLFAISSGFVDLNMNFGVLLICLTSLMVGKLALSITRPNIWIPIVGVIAYFVIQQSLLRMGLNLKYYNAFQAIFVLAVLLIGQKKRTLTLDHLGV